MQQLLPYKGLTVFLPLEKSNPGFPIESVYFRNCEKSFGASEGSSTAAAHIEKRVRDRRSRDLGIASRRCFICGRCRMQLRCRSCKRELLLSFVVLTASISILVALSNSFSEVKGVYCFYPTYRKGLRVLGVGRTTNKEFLLV